MATHETRAALVEAAFGFGARAASEEIEAKAMVVARPGLGHVCAMPDQGEPPERGAVGRRRRQVRGRWHRAWKPMRHWEPPRASWIGLNEMAVARRFA
jgi:hypothetical protein